MFKSPQSGRSLCDLGPGILSLLHLPHGVVVRIKEGREAPHKPLSYLYIHSGGDCPRKRLWDCGA